jgi:hypothetical protein
MVLTDYYIGIIARQPSNFVFEAGTRLGEQEELLQ